MTEYRYLIHHKPDGSTRFTAVKVETVARWAQESRQAAVERALPPSPQAVSYARKVAHRRRRAAAARRRKEAYRAAYADPADFSNLVGR